MNWRIRATFAGNLPPRQYLTPDIRHNNPGWDSEVFNRQIEQIELFLPTGHKVLLSGMEAYNFFIEATQQFSRRSQARIEAFWLCGLLPSRRPPIANSPSPIACPCPSPGVVDMWRIGAGKVVRQTKPFGREWGGTAIRGWKLGLVGSAPVSCIVRAA